MGTGLSVASSLLSISVALGAAGAAPPAKDAAKPPPAKPAKAKRQLKAASSVAPLPPGVKAAWSHAPFEAGDCSICHQKNDPKAPGPVTKAGNALCFSCHEEFQEIMQRKFEHPPAAENCTHCHNPHNSTERKLLISEQTSVCFGCHGEIQAVATSSKVKHDALTTEGKCANCHNPHAANIEKLLQQLPFDLCKKCHSKDGVPDGRGSHLTNFKKLLDENPNWHKPVRQKNCTACHRVHGGENFRLLVAEYPKAFYSPFEPKNYVLCFTCHNEKIVSEPETSFTGFRDGARNLHYLHVNRERGRTCRACHEVHASKQDHHIREGVPYGPAGWILKLNYTRTATGGQCTRTCHDTRAYNNTLRLASPKKE